MPHIFVSFLFGEECLSVSVSLAFLALCHEDLIISFSLDSLTRLESIRIKAAWHRFSAARWKIKFAVKNRISLRCSEYSDSVVNTL